MKEDKDDIVIEDDPDLTSSKGVEKKLRERLKAAEEKAKEYLDSWQRAQADFVNLRKKDEEAKLEFVKFASTSFIEDLLPVLDSFSLALAHGAKDIEPIYNQLIQVLKQRGLEELNPLGETFDPNLHESVGSLPAEKASDDHKILEVMQKGYILSGKIIRPAKVKIGEYNK